MTAAATVAAADPIGQLAAGQPVSGFVSQTLDEAHRLAEIIAQAGQGMIPEVYENNPGACFLAVAKGAELGLALLTALQCITPIEGRPPSGAMHCRVSSNAPVTGSRSASAARARPWSQPAR